MWTMFPDTCILLVATVFSFRFCEGANSSDLSRLLNVLFSNYSVLVRPVYNQNRPTAANVVFTLRQLESLNIKTQTLRSQGFFSINWTDEFLTWVPEDYGGIKYITVPESMVWKPDYVIDNDVNEKTRIGDGSSLVVVEYNGQTLWEPGYVSATTCSVNIKYFPFDEQKCSIFLTPWMTSNVSLLTSTTGGVQLHDFTESGEFVILGTSSERDTYPMTYIKFEGLVGIAFTLIVKRRTAFYWLSLVSPLIVFPYLSPLSFFVPADSGEKTTLAITALLSFFVFMGTIYDTLPELSNNISYFVLLVSVQVFISFLTIVFNVLILGVQKISSLRQVPKFLENEISKQYSELLRKTGETATQTKVTWEMVAVYINKVCFYVSLIAVTVVSAVFMSLMFI